MNSSNILNYKKYYFFVISLFIIILVWLLGLRSLGINDSDLYLRQIWGASYQIIALAGGILGFFVSRSWGGYKSLLGRAILFLSISLLFQCVGQSISSLYMFMTGNLPYPSLGDIGFLGSTICYIIAGWLLVRANGLHISFNSLRGKFVVFIVPIVLIISSYYFFLKDYQFDWTTPIKVFLDFGYPLGDALYVALAVVALIFCEKMMGGIMKSPIRLLIIALLFQYIADFTFLYQSNLGTWYVGGLNDLLYFSSYFLMSMSLIYIGQTFNKIRSSAS